MSEKLPTAHVCVSVCRCDLMCVYIGLCLCIVCVCVCVCVLEWVRVWYPNCVACCLLLLVPLYWWLPNSVACSKLLLWFLCSLLVCYCSHLFLPRYCLLAVIAVISREIISQWFGQECDLSVLGRVCVCACVCVWHDTSWEHIWYTLTSVTHIPESCHTYG